MEPDPATMAGQPAGHRDDTVRLLLPLVGTVFFGLLTMGIPLPVLPGQVHLVLGFNAVTVGWVVGIQYAATLLTRAFAGTACDRRGAKFAMMLGQIAAILAGVAYLLSALLPLAPAGSLAVLVVGRLLMGVAESMIITSGLAWGMGRVGLHRAGRAMAWNGIAMYASLAAGAPIGVALSQVSGFAGVAVAAILAPMAGLAVCLLVPGVPASGGGVRLSAWRVLRLISRAGAAMSFATVPFAALIGFLPLDYAVHHWNGAGIALTGFGAAYVLARVIFSRQLDHVTGPRFVVLCLLVEAAGQFLLWGAPTPLVACIGASVSGFGMSLVFPLLGVPAVRHVPPRNRGLAVGAYVGFMDLALGLSGPITGVIATGFGFPAVFLAGGASALLAVYLSLVAWRASERPVVPEM